MKENTYKKHCHSHRECQIESQAKMVLQQFSDSCQQTNALNVYSQSKIPKERAKVERIETWNSTNAQQNIQRGNSSNERYRFKKHFFQRNRDFGYMKQINRKNSNKKLCQLLETQKGSQTKQKGKEGCRLKQKCAISMLYPQFKQQVNIKTHNKQKSCGEAFDIRRSMRVGKQSFHQKRDLIIKKIKRELINSYQYRNQLNSSLQAKLLNIKMREANHTSNQIGFGLQCRTDTQQSLSATRQAFSLKTSKVHSKKKNRCLSFIDSEKQRQTTNYNSEPNQILRTTFQFQMLKKLLNREAKPI